jgi:hypothetical protein
MSLAGCNVSLKNENVQAKSHDADGEKGKLIVGG